MTDPQAMQQLVRQAQAGDPAAQEALADLLAESGRASDAARVLQAAAAAGRPSALGKFGLWRLVGHGAPQAPREGVAQILAAARAGDPAALRLAAVICAGGVGAPRDVPAALGWLVRAAESGDARAIAQLGLLAKVSGADPAAADQALALAASAGFAPAGQPGGAPAAGAPDYRRLASAVDADLFGPIPPSETVCEAPHIRTIADLLPAWACDYVVALAGPGLSRAMVVDERGGESVRQARTNTVVNFGLIDSDVVLELINTRLANAAGLPPERAEGLGVLHYAPGEEYAPHVDYIPDTAANAPQLAARGQRVRTLLVYLNEGFEGGATEFPRLDRAFRPPRGSALIFDSVTPQGQVDPLTLHRGAPPTRGEKWVISKWFRTKPLRPGPEAAT